MMRNFYITKLTCAALLFSIGCFGWLTFKQIEPTLFPVVTSFKIESLVGNGQSTVISGSMNKVRACDFVDVVAYSDNKFIGITFLNAPSRKKVTRLTGEQTFSNWELKPPVSNLRIYSTHRCLTGIVITELFNGELN